MSIGSKAASVKFDQVTKAYGAVTALDRVSFDIAAGELVTFLGPSGCGKTTTLRLVAGLEMLTSGRILIGGADVTTLPATDRDVSMVFQSYALFPHMSVLENVAYGLVVGGMKKTQAHEQAEAGLELVGLKGYGSRLPSELSGGQQQRVAVARALVLEPQVLLFDEPLSNLDAKLRRHVRQEIRDIQQNLGLTSIYVTHDQEEALAVSDRIIVMNNAVIAQEGTPHQLYEEPANLFVADFIGDANIASAEIRSLQDDGERAIVDIGGLLVNLPARGLKPGAARVAIRPEALNLAPAVSGNGGFTGQVRKATYLGNHLEFIVDTQLGELFAVEPDISLPVKSGDSVTITFGEHGVTLVQEAAS